MKNKEIKNIIKKGYQEIAKQGCGCNCSNQISKEIGYSKEEISNVPEANLGLGCGNPIALGVIKEGDVVLDLGSGAGFDAFLAAKKVGEKGKVIGVDLTLEMIKKAKENALKYDYKNVDFKLGDIEQLPIEDNSIDVIISNCVINLAPDKDKVFEESYRVLKSEGRMFVSDIVLLKELSNEQKKDEKLLTGCVAGALQKQDYITYPKEDGYRSLHLVYKYKSQKEGKKDYNGLLIEIQIRSKLQHLWATAVEVVDFFTGQGLKFDKGKTEWKDFFKLVSSAFAIMEETPLVPNTPLNKKELYTAIKEKEKELNLIKTMQSWTEILRVFGIEDYSKDYKFFLMEIDINQERLTISAFKENEVDKAIKTLERLEKKNRDRKEYDVVLVGADTITDLKKAYPNYFADSEEFLEKLKSIINKAN